MVRSEQKKAKKDIFQEKNGGLSKLARFVGVGGGGAKGGVVGVFGSFLLRREMLDETKPTSLSASLASSLQLS